MRVLLALGGNAMTGADGSARPEDQIAAAAVAMSPSQTYPSPYSPAPRASPVSTAISPPPTTAAP